MDTKRRKRNTDAAEGHGNPTESYQQRCIEMTDREVEKDEVEEVEEEEEEEEERQEGEEVNIKEKK